MSFTQTREKEAAQRAALAQIRFEDNQRLEEINMDLAVQDLRRLKHAEKDFEARLARVRSEINRVEADIVDMRRP